MDVTHMIVSTILWVTAYLFLQCQLPIRFSNSPLEIPSQCFILLPEFLNLTFHDAKKQEQMSSILHKNQIFNLETNVDEPKK